MAFRSCSGGFDVGGSSNPTGGFYRGIREHAANCVQARAVVHGYVVKLHGVAGSLNGRRAQVGGYICITIATATSDAASCKASRGRIVKFYGAP